VSEISNKLWSAIDDIVRTVFAYLFRIIGKEYTATIHESLMQFVKFGIVGVSNTVISFILYSALLILLRYLGVFPQYDYLISSIIAFVLSVLWSFYWNNKMVFVIEKGYRRNVLKALLKTFISYSFTGLFLSSILLVIWVQIFNVSEFLAPLINLLVSVPLNFIINKFWAFKAD